MAQTNQAATLPDQPKLKGACSAADFSVVAWVKPSNTVSVGFGAANIKYIVEINL